MSTCKHENKYKEEIWIDGKLSDDCNIVCTQCWGVWRQEKS